MRSRSQIRKSNIFIFGKNRVKEIVRFNRKTALYGMRIFLIALFLFSGSFCFSQNDKYIPVNLTTVLKLAGANNLTIKQYELQYQLGLAQVDKAREWYLPSIFVGPSFHYLQG